MWHGASTVLAGAMVIALVLPGCDPPAPETAGGAVGPEEEVQRLADEARERLQAGGEGGLLVLRAIEAHGGLEAWYRAPTSSYTWEYANVGADLRFRSFLVADNRTREVYHDLLLTGSFDDPDEVDARFAWDGRDAWIHPETGRVDAIRYTVSYGRDVGPDADLPETLFYYEDFVTVDGLTVATAFRGYDFTETGERGEFKNEAFADSISFRRPFDPNLMNAPEDARFVPPPGG